MWWQAISAAAAALAVTWLVLAAVLWVARPDRGYLRESARVLPDVLRLVGRLARDRSLPSTLRWRVWLLVAYLALPFDVVPDFIPVIGYADDVVLVVITMRAVIRRAGPDAVERHWPGTDDGLATLRRLIGS